MARVLGGIIGLTMAGCASSTDPTGDAGPDAASGLSVDDYCPTQAEVLCTGWQSCCELESYEGCIALMLEECEAGEISSIRAGNSVLDGEVAERCMEAYADSFDDCMRDDPLAEACRYRWYGDAAPGEPCRDVWHCQRGLGCVLEGTSGTCVEIPTTGEPCDEYGVCEPGSYCSYEDWTCHDEPRLGEACERPGICAAGSCVADHCLAVPWCP